ncbi:MAG: cytochrome c oxidase subunit II [Paracoccaceae bacterium]
MMRIGKVAAALGSLSAVMSAASGVWAQDAFVELTKGLESIGKPFQGGKGFQPAVTPVAEDLQWLDGMILVIITAICLLVIALLAIIVLRFNSRANPNPARFTHNSALEVTWTLVPVVILIVIGSFSLPVLFEELEVPESDLTIKVTGNQWFWSYEYPDDEIAFDSFMIGPDSATLTDEIKAELVSYGYSDDEWQLATDTAVVVPVDTVVRVQVTGSDVIHSWAVPAFGVKLDAVPGRLAETWFEANREGVYFGQCSELCGKSHAYMPIVVKVVSRDVYAKWMDLAKQEYASRPARINLAQAD